MSDVNDLLKLYFPEEADEESDNTSKKDEESEDNDPNKKDSDLNKFVEEADPLRIFFNSDAAMDNFNTTFNNVKK
ncbi:MAG: hypothetical protein KA278_08320 [Flavobacterium sp.]|nr:hypothetical protein [Flavobacterium sp.]